MMELYGEDSLKCVDSLLSFQYANYFLIRGILIILSYNKQLNKQSINVRGDV